MDSLHIFDFFKNNFTLIFLIVGAFIVLSRRKEESNYQLKDLRTTIILITVLVIVNGLETYFSNYPNLYYLRMTCSILGYSIRPLIVLGLVLFMKNSMDMKKNVLLFIPAIINILIYLTAYFCDIAFTFNDSYVFVRGPLGYTVFIVACIYMVVLLWYTFKTFREKRIDEALVLLLCTTACILASILEMGGYAEHILNESIILSCIFYYFFIRIRTADRDTATKLLNGYVFYSDIKKYEKDTTALVALEINGLQKINEEKGFATGDETLKLVGSVLNTHSNKNMIPYRVAGAKFSIIYVDTDEEYIDNDIKDIYKEILKQGVGTSIGLAYKKGNIGSEKLFKNAEDKMYEERKQYKEIMETKKKTVK